MRVRARARLLWGCVALISLIVAQLRAETKDDPAKVKVSGYGVFGNRELKGLVSLLQTGKEMPRLLEANYVEDSVLIIFSRLARDGYLFPTIRVEAEFEDGLRQEFVWTEPLGEPLPRPFDARQVEFKVEPSVLFYFEEVRFSGLDDLMPLRDAAHFFIETDALLPIKKNRRYSPEKLLNGVRSIEDVLQRRGYETPGVLATNLLVQTNTGAVTVDIFIHPGPQSIVRLIEKVLENSDTNSNPAVRPSPEFILTNAIYSRVWEQDFAQQLRREQYERGNADVRVEITQLTREPHAGTNYLDLRARILPGKQIRVGVVEFEGHTQTEESVMRRRVSIASGDLLDPVKAERGRYRLARLGIFDSVELRYDEVNDDTRDVIYKVDEGKKLDFSILAGYGSYEKLRGGFELEQYNLWGRAHSSRLKVIQSFKSSSADYLYTMPELLGEDFDVFINASGLRREEVAFVREEFGGGAGVSRQFRKIDTDLSARYNYQVLTATREEIPPEFGLEEANVGSFIFDMRHDRRDNPLTPRAGYKIFSTLEVASEVLLGDVDFQRMETSISYHHSLGRLQWLHFGVSHGFVTTVSGPETDLPVNRRFFPGGDNSIRGYQYGEASPRNEDGDFVGAETYTLANIEYEQGLTLTWSVVFFFDALAQATSIDNWPADEGLYSAGIGIRWKSLIGPVRLEYGHNLNRRDDDPSGTVHLSVGFPF
ncbi:MAG TPA: BamA/TamA family outer membrane protein [Candidatus Kapabacteria bacterium]|nr:BamA/TamA family outer membrane protein [Candidatus Kapabacteria bacterium]